MRNAKSKNRKTMNKHLTKESDCQADGAIECSTPFVAMFVTVHSFKFVSVEFGRLMTLPQVSQGVAVPDRQVDVNQVAPLDAI